MDERAALALVAEHVDTAGDDAAIVDDLVVTTDMLHAETDFPSGTTRYTAGWRSVAASLSDVAAMGAPARAAVAVYAAPRFEESELAAFLDGATDVCETVDAAYVGGDLDQHQEFTVATTAIGHSADPIRRSGAQPGNTVCVTGSLGRSAAAVRLFDTDPARANELYQFHPRIEAGQVLADVATAMIDSSDGLARSVHQLATASDCGFALDSDEIPVTTELDGLIADPDTRFEEAITYGEDFELIATVPADAVDELTGVAVDITPIGTVTQSGVTIDGDPLPDTGYTHGTDL